ncbi:hypothetical protein U9M48_009571 [Paspalum notatum var. saurae]|uniref:DUF3615 domain-containing protein n=1 Tax=Paspalum notatum var. saurae TaxID=547442 RepID=A0AAQ3WFD5_PASNO
MEGAAEEMTRPLRKAAAAASPAGDRPVKSRRGGAPPPLDLKAPASAWTAAGSGSSIRISEAQCLRSGRRIFVALPRKAGPLQLTKRQKAVYNISWRSPAACAKAALEHYNRTNEDEHELVKALEPAAFLCIGGMWIHANFIAKPKGGTGCADRAPKHFFTELKGDTDEKGKQKLLCVSCIKMDRANPKTKPVRGCKRCPIFHPAAGGYKGAAEGDREAA